MLAPPEKVVLCYNLRTMEKTSSRKPIIGLFILLFLGVIILGLLALLQNREINRLSAQKPVAEAQAVVEKTIVTQENFDGKYSITQYCEGTVEDVTYEAYDFTAKNCMGENSLVYSDGIQNKTILTQGFAKEGYYPALFLQADFVSSTKNNAHILVEFRDYAYCFATNKCRHGISSGYNYSIDVLSATTTFLNSFPPGSKIDSVYWNPEGTRAVIVESTCMEGGCDKAPLGGYDLEKDEFRTITKEQAVGSVSYTDVDLAAYGAHWKSVEWKSDKEFAATLINPDGTKKIIKGTF